ncbi:MAG TPA: DUF4180 domain-containing protein [Steroidobacteraceae bacterium]|nr:DUF4180 domain-containing protein [Steroidobacteraceae bacterium]
MTEQPRILIAAEAGISVGSINDILNAVASTFGAGGLILTEDDVSSEFFDLKTGLAGELFQKFENYELCLAIIVPSPERYGERFNELAREHKSHNRIRIVRSKDEALAWVRRGR